MLHTITHTVPKLDKPQRLQDYGVGIFETLSTKSALKKALKKGLIKVNDTTGQTGTFIQGGESISLTISEADQPKSRLILPLKVIFEDEHLAAIYKPAGILVSGNGFKTIARALPQNLQRSTLADATIPQPVHRLDYATTGILLCGKTSSAIRTLNELFASKEVTKTYYAITIGKMHDSGTVSSPVDDKPSQSDYEVISTVPSERFKYLNLVKLRPLTGRRHQLRKHTASLGTPILGDKDYGIADLLLKGKGLYLHASIIEFTHPFIQERLQLIAPLPERFVKIFPAIENGLLSGLST